MLRASGAPMAASMPCTAIAWRVCLQAPVLAPGLNEVACPALYAVDMAFSRNELAVAGRLMRQRTDADGDWLLSNAED